MSANYRQFGLCRLLSLALKLFVTYTVFLLVWQCPPNSQLDSASHSFCHPLHNLISQADPYYQQYAAPYVEIARPYYNNQVKPYTDVLHVKVVGPAIDKSVKAYSDYVHPVVSQNYEKLHQYAQPYSDKVVDTFNSQIEPAGSSAWSSASDYFDKIKESVIEPGYDKLKENVITPGQEKLSEYGQETIEYGRNQLYPQAMVYGAIAREWISTNLAHGWKWLVAIVSPKVNTIYRKAIEPQVNKIIDRIFENTERALTSNSDAGTSATGLDDATTTATVESDDSVDFVQATETSQDSEPDTENVFGSGAEKTFDEPTGVDYDPFSADQRKSTNADEEEEEEDEFKNVDIIKELNFWKIKVEKTNKDALESFTRDIKAERERVIEKHRPEFNKHLFSLQKYQQNGFAGLRSIINMLETSDENDETLSHEMIENKVKEYTDEIEDTIEKLQKQTQRAELEVRTCTEAIRDNTIEILDVFSNVMISELGRILVSQDKDQMSSKARWEDWKEYTSLKDYLKQTRDRVTKYDIPLIADIVSQIQVTAQVLADEANQHALALKGKADHLLILRVKKRDAVVVDDSEVEFYDAEEEEENSEVEVYDAEEEEENSEVDKEGSEQVPTAANESTKEIEDKIAISLEKSPDSSETNEELLQNIREASAEPTVAEGNVTDTEPDHTDVKEDDEQAFEETLENSQSSSFIETTSPINTATGSTGVEFTATGPNDYIQETSSKSTSTATVSSSAVEDTDYNFVNEDEDYDVVGEDEDYDVIDNETESEAFELVFEDDDGEFSETFTSTRTKYVTITKENTAALFSPTGSAGSSPHSTEVAANTAATVNSETAKLIDDEMLSENAVSNGENDEEDGKNESKLEEISTSDITRKSTSYTTRVKRQTKVVSAERDEL